MHQSFRSPKGLVFTPLLLLLLFVVACGSASQPVEPQVIEKEVIREIEVIKEVPVEKIVGKEVVKEIIVVATPAPVVAPDWVSIGQGNHYNGVVELLWRNNPGFWDVHYGGSSTTTLMPSAVRFNQLVEYNPVETTEVIGDLAESWEISADGMEYIFKLRDAKWADGMPVTAEDIVFSLDRIVEPGTLRGRVKPLMRFYEYQTAEVIDAKTVKMPLKFAGATFLKNLAIDYMKMYPEHVAGKLSQDEMNCCPEKMVGSGPWIFKEWSRDVGYEHERNPNYFKAPRPFFDGLKVFLVQDYARALAALQTRQVMGTYGPILTTYRPEDVLRIEVETGGKMKAYVKTGTTTYDLLLRITEPPFDDPKVRRAVYLAINRQDVVKVALTGYGSPGTFFPSGYVEDSSELEQLPGYRLTAEGKKSEEDLEEARRLLAEAGYTDGFEASINVSRAKIGLTAAEIIADQLRAIGLDITIRAKDTATAYVELRDGAHAMTIQGTGLIINEPENILDQFYSLDTLRNPHNWENARVTELMEAQTTERDPAKRKEMFKEIVDILRENPSHKIPLMWTHAGGMLDYRMQNFQVQENYHTVRKWDHIWFDPDTPLPTTIK
jgi:peptide/nickel transport system substrate-binding protein